MGFVITIIRLIIRWLKRLRGAEKPSAGVRMLTPDGYLLTDTNGLLFTTKEE